MPETIGTALIAGAATILGASIPVIASWIHGRNGPFLPVTTERQRSIAGRWEGTGEDQFVENGKPPVKLAALFELSISGRRINGEAAVRVTVGLPEGLQNTLKLTGGFCDHSLMQLTYQSADSKRVQYGVILLRLSETGDGIDGHYAGYSPTRHCLVIGKFNLARVQL